MSQEVTDLQARVEKRLIAFTSGEALYLDWPDDMRALQRPPAEGNAAGLPCAI